MPEEIESNGGETSDVMSENELEYDEQDAFLKDDDKMNENAKQEIGPDGEVKKKYDPKDPMRPRRKKARRACFACQRAHLTCGDERPCQRCIKRGLADHCQDGVRKKAKYLHDAPPEALRPVLGPNYNPNAPQNRPNGQRQPTGGSEATPNVNNFFSPTTASNPYPLFTPQSGLGALSAEEMAFPSQHSPVSPTFQAPNPPQLSGLTVPQVSGPVSGDMNNMTTSFFDPSNPALYNFNLEGLNFGSQYGAMEFGMLNQMSSGAAETSPRDPAYSQGGGDPNFSAGAFGNGMQQFDGGMMGDMLSIDQPGNSLYNQGNLQHGLPHAYAIAAGPPSYQSPSTDNDSPQPSHNVGYEGSTATGYHGAPGSQALGAQPRQRSKPSIPKVFPQSLLGKRPRDPSIIYETVKEPFQYVQGFHRLIAFLKRRFRTSGDKLVRIAEALGSFRPSFISCTRTLNRADLVFMEKCFQRTLFEYEDFMQNGSSPTVVCRRTGEIAAVNKEFTALTGWPKAVLLGSEPNLNVNTGGGGNISSATSEGYTTPRLESLNDQAEKDKPLSKDKHPMFIAELMDDDSVVQFYEDFAQLAFGDSRSSVQRSCKLLKYRTHESMDGGASNSSAQQSPAKDPRSIFLSNRVARIDGEHGISRIAKDGKLECTYCWVIRRDTFDMPMMIVINGLAV
ncbi:Transcriptional regulator of nonfermentable carbon utilization [Cytospora paraplurivora]|uniref:Transcriptional regulator of nonfermentable carbon utilization n=1 Tax=Cytospora paraplurivora TaxID=2898453 RepID=A0AAN9UGH7_9PEZI